MLGDVEKIRQERRKAKANKTKFAGQGNDGGMSFVTPTGGRYGGFGSDSLGGGGGGDSGGYEGYSGGRDNGYDNGEDGQLAAPGTFYGKQLTRHRVPGFPVTWLFVPATGIRRIRGRRRLCRRPAAPPDRVCRLAQQHGVVQACSASQSEEGRAEAARGQPV